jgi:hypothetical protein
MREEPSYVRLGPMVSAIAEVAYRCTGKKPSQTKVVPRGEEVAQRREKVVPGEGRSG